MNPSVCPNCGIALEPLQAFTLGSLGIDKSGAAIWWSGHEVPLTTAERLIVVTLARTAGYTVAQHVLAEDAGCDGDNPGKCVSVHICRARKAFKGIDPGFDRIECVRGQGFRWRVE